VLTRDDLDRPCGRHLCFRDLIEAGETWRRVRVPNLPEQPDTVAALQRLARDVLDPVVEQFGPIEITYGFASRDLTRHIPGRIDPSLDQHAGHELRPDGLPICRRLGQAVDLRVPGLCSGALAAWIAVRLPFDRLYFYGMDRPLHVSVGPEEARAVVSMLPGPRGRRVPQRRSPDWLVASFAPQ
jgi:hypothetical protein